MCRINRDQFTFPEQNFVMLLKCCIQWQISLRFSTYSDKPEQHVVARRTIAGFTFYKIHIHKIFLMYIDHQCDI